MSHTKCQQPSEWHDNSFDPWRVSVTTSRTKDQQPIVVPFTVVVDTSEGAPYQFTQMRADADKQYRPLCVPTRWQKLKTGDYSIVGLESLVTVERKSLSDLFTTLGQGRERFKREHERMAEMEFAAVVIEADWPTILKYPPERSQLVPKTIFRTAASWMQRYGVPWLAMSSRGLAEATTFRLLQTFWRHKQEQERKIAT